MSCLVDAARVRNGTRPAAAAALVAAGMVLAPASPAAAADWPMAAGAPGNNRPAADETPISADTAASLAPMRVLTTDGNNWATPVVGDGRAFFADSGGTLWAIDAASGDVLWSAAISDYNGVEGSSVRSSAAYADGTVFFGDRGGANMIV